MVLLATAISIALLTPKIVNPKIIDLNVNSFQFFSLFCQRQACLWVLSYVFSANQKVKITVKEALSISAIKCEIKNVISI